MRPKGKRLKEKGLDTEMLWNQALADESFSGIQGKEKAITRCAPWF